MIEIKKRSWDDISINDYYDIQDIIESKENEIDKQVKVLAILCDAQPEDIYDLSMTEIAKLNSKIGWINEFNYDKKFHSKKITVANNEYTVSVDLQAMSISQYIDFQTFWGKNNLRQYIGNILAVFLVPKGKKYCDGYNAAELAASFRDTISITLASSICFFFAKSLQISIVSTILYSEWLMKKLEKRKDNPLLMEKVKQAKEQARRLMAFLTER